MHVKISERNEVKINITNGKILQMYKILRIHIYIFIYMYYWRFSLNIFFIKIYNIKYVNIIYYFQKYKLK